jgi:hypothetical protein
LYAHHSLKKTTIWFSVSFNESKMTLRLGLLTSAGIFGLKREEILASDNINLDRQQNLQDSSETNALGARHISLDRIQRRFTRASAK